MLGNQAKIQERPLAKTWPYSCYIMTTHKEMHNAPPPLSSILPIWFEEFFHTPPDSPFAKAKVPNFIKSENGDRPESSCYFSFALISFTLFIFILIIETHKTILTSGLSTRPYKRQTNCCEWLPRRFVDNPHGSHMLREILRWTEIAMIICRV